MGDRSLDDEDFQYGDSDDLDVKPSGRSVRNMPHDEEVALSDSDSMQAIDRAGAASDHMGNRGPMRGRDDEDDDDNGGMGMAQDDDDDNGPITLPPDDDPDNTVAYEGSGLPGGYNAQDFKHLNVSDEIRDLFKYIGRYKPHDINLDTKLKCFIPDYIPAVGGIDEFIKVPRPDGKPDFLGLKILDEPATKQSDPTVLSLQLRQLTKDAPGAKVEHVGRVEHNDENKTKKIQGWIQSVLDIQKSKPTAHISYSHNMPDIEMLMQEWPPEIEAFVRAMKLPQGDVDLDLRTFVKLVCSVLDIPVYDNPIESLHVLFTLYLEFKNNPFFKQHVDMTGFSGDQGMTALTDAFKNNLFNKQHGPGFNGEGMSVMGTGLAGTPSPVGSRRDTPSGGFSDSPPFPRAGGAGQTLPPFPDMGNSNPFARAPFGPPEPLSRTSFGEVMGGGGGGRVSFGDGPLGGAPLGAPPMSSDGRRGVSFGGASNSQSVSFTDAPPSQPSPAAAQASTRSMRVSFA